MLFDLCNLKRMYRPQGTAVNAETLHTHQTSTSTETTSSRRWVVVLEREGGGEAAAAGGGGGERRRRPEEMVDLNVGALVLVSVGSSNGFIIMVM